MRWRARADRIRWHAGWPAGAALAVLLFGLGSIGPPTAGWPAQARAAAADERNAGRAVPTRLDQAWFASSAQGPWQPVLLPDTWAQRGMARPTSGWYRVRLSGAAAAGTSAAGAPADMVPGPADPVLAVRTEHISRAHRLWLNGALLNDAWHSGAAGRATGPSQLVPMLQQLPPALLRPGDNWLTLQVDGGLRAGLSPLWLGSAGDLAPAHRQRLWWAITLPQQLNLAGAGACLFALLLWWRRRNEAAMGWFGLMGLLASLRNQAYYLPSPGLPPALTSALFFGAQVLTATMLGLFAMSLTRQQPRGYRRLLLGSAGLMLLAGAWASVDERLDIDRVRGLAYPLLALLTLPALLLIARRVQAMRGGELVALLPALVAVVVAGGHDYLYQQGRLPITETWWLPLATPLLVLAFAVLMIGRVVQAMTEVERLNHTLEHRVRERTQALATANAAKSRFLAAASHDLRQPVVTIGLLVGLLREQVTAPAQRSMVARVDQAVASMESLLAGLLDLSRLDAGNLRVRLQPVPLQPLFDAVAVHEADAARRKGLSLRLRPTTLVARADTVLLQQVLRNLVSNALRYTDAGGVLVAVRRAGGKLRLQVWDTGRGIAAADQQTVFEEFVQLDNPQRERSQGLGLGLAIVQRSAALLGAQLSLRSQPGRGSCFSLDLPLCEGRADGEAAAAVAALPTWLAGLHVVVVENEPAVAEALRARLAAWGAEVLVHDGPRALRLALDHLAPDARRADLLVTDWRLPGGNGADVVALARRRFGPLPVLVVTGSTAPADIAALGATGLAVLHKPFRAEELQAAISAVLSAPPAP